MGAEVSVRNLKHIFCATCKVDTLHNTCKCTICGTIFETPTDARSRFYKGVYVRNVRLYGSRIAAEMNQARGRHINREKRKAGAHLPYTASPEAPKCPGLRTGRERTHT